MIANLRLFDPRGRPRPYNDLMGFVPPGEIPHLFLALPYSAREVSAPALALTRLLHADWALRGLLVWDGVRLASTVASWRNWLGPVNPQDPDYEAYAKHRNLIAELAEYDRPFGPHHPTVRFAAAAVEMAVRSGASVLVIVTPVPVKELATRGLYGAERYGERIGVLADAVEAKGGTLVDLHAALATGGLRDAGGHLSSAGAEQMVTLTGPRVAAMLVPRDSPPAR